MSAAKNLAKCLKVQKSIRNDANNGDLVEGFTQKLLLQIIRLFTAKDD
jgi:hypothetical protein